MNPPSENTSQLVVGQTIYFTYLDEKYARTGVIVASHKDRLLIKTFEDSRQKSVRVILTLEELEYRRLIPGPLPSSAKKNFLSWLAWRLNFESI